MNQATLNDIMLITFDGPVTPKFDAKRAADSWLGRGKRRLETGHKTQDAEKRKLVEQGRNIYHALHRDDQFVTSIEGG